MFCRYFQKLPIQYYKMFHCSFCGFLRKTLSNGIFEFCMDEEEKEKLGLKLIPLKEYLFKNITASTFFVFNEELKEIDVCIDNPDWGDFFYDLETM